MVIGKKDMEELVCNMPVIPFLFISRVSHKKKTNICDANGEA